MKDIELNKLNKKFEEEKKKFNHDSSNILLLNLN
jgi:hypothetical protein